MASTSTTVSLSSSSTLIDGKAPRQHTAALQGVTIPRTLPPLPLPPQSCLQPRDSWKTTAYGRKMARNVMAMAAGESSIMATGEATVEMATTELPQIVKTIQEAWDKVEDKYAVSSLALAAAVALCGAAGMISAIDRLPLVPFALEIVGMGYTGSFAYKNLIFKPDREALIKKIKDVYSEIIGSS